MLLDALRRARSSRSPPASTTSSTSCCSTTSPSGTCSDRFANERDAGCSTPCTTQRLYGKEGSWESVRAPVDLQLANSNWTADQICAETGHRPTVQLGGVNRDVFRPYGGRKRYPVLCPGGDGRPWKGTDTILAAGPAARRPGGALRREGSRPARPRPRVRRRPGLRGGELVRGVLPARARGAGVRRPPRHHRQRRLPRVRDRRRDRARRPAAGPRAPWPTRSGGSSTIGSSPTKLVANGLDLVERDFDWERRTDEFAEILDGVSAGTALAPPPRRPDPPADPELSIVVLAWDNLEYTQRFVESVTAAHRRRLRADRRRQRLGAGRPRTTPRPPPTARS